MPPAAPGRNPEASLAIANGILTRRGRQPAEPGDQRHGRHDAAGNRLSQAISGTVVTTYTYDIANRLVAVGAQANTWDANGNLLDDGASTYGYDAANRLVSVSQGAGTHGYTYSGLGDRLSQTVNGVPIHYALDMAGGLTQVLDDGTNTYLYGMGRVGEAQPGGFVHHLGDALGSVRQLADASGELTLARGYEPFGSTLLSVGDGATSFQFTGEARDDGTGLTFLRARYFSPVTGRFVTRDPWNGSPKQPLSFNKWLYGYNNPTNVTDPSGLRPDELHSKYCQPLAGSDRLACEKIVRGISLDTNLSLSDLTRLDWCHIQGDLCGRCDRLFDRVDYSGDTLSRNLHYGVAEPYGYWFHHLLNTTTGWWNPRGRTGKTHVYFRSVVAIAFGVELSPDPDILDDDRLNEAMAEAFARKAWGEGFYRMIGGRQSVQSRVNNALFSVAGDPPWPNRPAVDREGLEANLGVSLSGDNALRGQIARTKAGLILSRADWRSVVDNRPYEWGNPTEGSPALFLDTLRQRQWGANGQYGLNKDEIYYSTRKLEARYLDPSTGIYRIAVVVTEGQQRFLCNGGSCVGPGK